MQPVVFGLAGATLLPEEARFFRDADPLGFILFTRNCVDRRQIVQLTSALRDSVGRPDAPIFIDQEGGRVARLGPPHWPRYPSAKVFGDLARTDVEAAEHAVRLNSALIGADLREVGITANCAPLVDVPADGAHEMIGDRAFASDPIIVSRLGRAACEGFLSVNVLPVVKHLPGYGRARVDSHKALPVIDDPVEALAATDLRPFMSLADVAWGMTAHALYTAIDPDRPATVSAKVIGEVARGWIGFKGILITDDLSMEALQGTIGERAAASLAAGCDVALHCNGDLVDMRAIADVLPSVREDLKAKIDKAEAMRAAGTSAFATADVPDARREIEHILAQA